MPPPALSRPWPSASASRRLMRRPSSPRCWRNYNQESPSQSPRRRPPFAHDGTERRIGLPQDPAKQTECYSGKKKDHTVKNVLLVHALLVIFFLSDTHGGHVHDLRIAEATPSPLPAGSGLLQDLGFLSCTLPEVAILMPTKKPRGGALSLEQERANQALHQRPGSFSFRVWSCTAGGKR